MNMMIARNKNIKVVEEMKLDTQSFKGLVNQFTDVYHMIPLDYKDDVYYSIYNDYSGDFHEMSLTVGYTIPMTEKEVQEERVAFNKIKEEEERQGKMESLQFVKEELSKYPDHWKEIWGTK